MKSKDRQDGMSRTPHRKIFIRTDSNTSIAGGHVMRCLSLADALMALGADVEFVLSDDGPVEVIQSRGFSSRVLGTDWRELIEGVDVLCGLCDSWNDPIVLIDTYSVTAEYVDRLSSRAKVCYLGSKDGDLGDLSLVVNYSTHIDESYYERTYGLRGTKLLLGPGYAPLRECFSKVYRQRRGCIVNVLVTTGSTDPFKFLPVFLGAALEDARLLGVRFKVVIGGMVAEETCSAVERIAFASNRVEILRAVSDMAGLMGRCDAAVSANGTTIYELAAAGVPTVAFSMVEEQVASGESLARLGAIKYAGFMGKDVSQLSAKCVNRLAELVSDPVQAVALAGCAHDLIDGFGAQKIAKEMMLL